MGPMDAKGRTVLPESQILQIAISFSAMHGHFKSEERDQDELFIRKFLEILSAFGYLVMPQAALDGSIESMQDLLDAMRKASGAIMDTEPEKP